MRRRKPVAQVHERVEAKVFGSSQETAGLFGITQAQNRRCIDVVRARDDSLLEPPQGFARLCCKQTLPDRLPIWLLRDRGKRRDKSRPRRPGALRRPIKKATPRAPA